MTINPVYSLCLLACSLLIAHVKDQAGERGGVMDTPVRLMRGWILLVYAVIAHCVPHLSQTLMNESKRRCGGECECFRSAPNTLHL